MLQMQKTAGTCFSWVKVALLYLDTPSNNALSALYIFLNPVKLALKYTNV